MHEFEWSTDYKNRCGNCHAFLQHDDKYCRECGTKRGEGAFAPYKNMLDVQYIYGPPLTYNLRQCIVCQKSWKTWDPWDYCPDCGGHVAVIKELDASEDPDYNNPFRDD